MSFECSSHARAFLGRGWAFPLDFDETGEVRMVGQEDDIRESVRIILDSEPGERVMRPDFGAGLRALTFEPMSAAMIALVRHRVEQALIAWEPRIDTITVDVQTDRPAGRLMLEINYRVRSTNTFYNLVYPFYLMEGR